jgi:hypothetical protein
MSITKWNYLVGTGMCLASILCNTVEVNWFHEICILLTTINIACFKHDAYQDEWNQLLLPSVNWFFKFNFIPQSIRYLKGFYFWLEFQKKKKKENYALDDVYCRCWKSNGPTEEEYLLWKKKKTNRILTNSSNVCKLLQPFNDSRMEPPVWLRAYRRIEKRDEEGFEWVVVMTSSFNNRATLILPACEIETWNLIACTVLAWICFADGL